MQVSVREVGRGVASLEGDECVLQRYVRVCDVAWTGLWSIPGLLPHTLWCEGCGLSSKKSWRCDQAVSSGT